jgi:general secretion pathway protein I
VSRRRPGGFTLVEVLVALIIVAFGIGALLKSLTAAADNVRYLRDKSFAEWVALNRLSELRLTGGQPGAGKVSGAVDFAGAHYRWSQEITDPGIAGIRRVDVSVHDGTAKDDAPALAVAYGFVGLAVGPPSGIDPDWSLESLANAGGANAGVAKP